MVRTQEESRTVSNISENAVVRLDHVSKNFGPVRAVSDSCLEVPRGEIVTLLGPSGCGKTTTLRMVIGLERASEGEVHYLGKVVDSPRRHVFVPAHKRNMGMVFQSYAIWPHMTVFENVAYPLRIRRVSGADIRRRVGSMLELVGLSGYEERPATMLSGGQMQRVAVARSLVFEPDILLLDEPFSNLDAKLREQMRAEIKLLQRRLGATILFVTHDQVEALSLSDRLVVMHQGRIEQEGSPVELYRNPKTEAVRDFLGRTVMLAGFILEREDSGMVTVRLHGENGPVVRGKLQSDGGVASGSPCAVAVRPEQTYVVPEADGPVEELNNVSAILSALLFIGDKYEARVELPWGESVLLYLPLDTQWHEGQRIVIKLDPNGLQVWPT
ncbi:MAG: ABC transporter ATP-binding protein [Nitrospirales bacterium]